MTSYAYCFLKKIRLKNKEKVVPIRVIKAYRGNGGIAPLILKLENGWR
jgi:hypothetical protein